MSLEKAKVTSIVMSVIYILFGIFMALMPAESINVLCIVLGVLIALNGLIKLIEYFKNRTFSILLYIALIYLVLGIAVAILAPIIIESAIFIILIGVFFIIKGIADIGYSLDYKRAGFKSWWIDLVFAGVLVVMGVLFLINPFKTNQVLLSFIGICIAVNGIFSLIDLSFQSNKSKKINKEFRDAYNNIKYDIEDEEK